MKEGRWYLEIASTLPDAGFRKSTGQIESIGWGSWDSGQRWKTHDSKRCFGPSRSVGRCWSAKSCPWPPGCPQIRSQRILSGYWRRPKFLPRPTSFLPHKKPLSVILRIWGKGEVLSSDWGAVRTQTWIRSIQVYQSSSFQGTKGSIWFLVRLLLAKTNERFRIVKEKKLNAVHITPCAYKIQRHLETCILPRRWEGNDYIVVAVDGLKRAPLYSLPLFSIHQSKRGVESDAAELIILTLGSCLKTTRRWTEIILPCEIP